MLLERIVHDDSDATSGSGNPQDAGYQKIKDDRGGSFYPCPAFHTPFLGIFPQPEAETTLSAIKTCGIMQYCTSHIHISKQNEVLDIFPPYHRCVTFLW